MDLDNRAEQEAAIDKANYEAKHTTKYVGDNPKQPLRENESAYGYVDFNQQNSGHQDQIPAQGPVDEIYSTPPEPVIKSAADCKTLEDIQELAQDKGVVIPKNELEDMRKALENRTATPDYIATVVDNVAVLKDKQGLVWKDKAEEHTDQEVEAKQGKTMATLRDKNGHVEVYVKEFTVQDAKLNPANNGRQFYAATRIDRSEGNTPDKIKHVPMTTNYSLEGIKNNINAYYSKILFNQVTNEHSNEVRKEKEQNIKTPEKSREPVIESPGLSM